MTKQTKSARFRALYPTIAELLEQYTYDGVREILKDEYDLNLTDGTFRSYIVRYKNEGNATNAVTEESTNQSSESKPLKQQNSSSKIDSNSESPTPEELDNLLNEVKTKVSNKSILDK